MKTIPDHHVREIRALYEQRVLAPRREGKRPTMAVKDIAKLYGTTPKWVYLIGMRLARDTVPDEPAASDEGRTEAKPSRNTLAQRKVRARKPPASRSYPSHRRADGTFASDPS